MPVLEMKTLLDQIPVIRRLREPRTKRVGLRLADPENSRTVYLSDTNRYSTSWKIARRFSTVISPISWRGGDSPIFIPKALDGPFATSGLRPPREAAAKLIRYVGKSGAASRA